MSTAEWHPRVHNGICAFTVAVGESSELRASITHNANWAVAHGCSFTLFRTKMASTAVHGQWEKVHALEKILAQRSERGCQWLLFIDADAVVSDVQRSPEPRLRKMEEEAAPGQPVLFAACNSPLGRGLNCDIFCCGRQRQLGSHTRADAHLPRPGCGVGLHEVGPASPYPCMINSGVFFVRATHAEAQPLVKEWLAKQGSQSQIFGEQASLNELKEAWPTKIEVVGGQVMNTHTSFHRRMLRTEGAREVGRLAYDIALRISSHYEPTPANDERLNRSAYEAAALTYFERPLTSRALRESLTESLGECIHGPSSFICHPFASSPDRKQAIARHVARARRPRLEELLRAQQQLPYVTLEDALADATTGSRWATAANDTSSMSSKHRSRPMAWTSRQTPLLGAGATMHRRQRNAVR
jgi:hypothetical protein